MAIAVLVYGRTHSAFLTALAYALTYLPPIADGPLLSGLADLFPRRRIMIVCDLFRVGTVGLMAMPGLPFAVLCVLLLCTARRSQYHLPGQSDSRLRSRRGVVAVLDRTGRSVWTRLRRTHVRCTAAH